MKKIINKFLMTDERKIPNEAGQVLIGVLILLLLIGVLAVPLLSTVATGSKIATTYDNSTNALYIADAGVQDAVWQLNNATGNKSAHFYYQDTTAASPTITAASGSLTTATQTETVNPGSLASITVSPSSPTVAVNGTQNFTAQGYDQYSNPVSATITWSIATGQSAAGSINSSTRVHSPPDMPQVATAVPSWRPLVRLRGILQLQSIIQYPV